MAGKQQNKKGKEAVMFHPYTENIEAKKVLNPSVFGFSPDADSIGSCSQIRTGYTAGIEMTNDASEKTVGADAILKNACGLNMSCTLNAMAAEAEKNAAWRDEFNKFAAWRFYAAAGYVVAMSALVSLLVAM
jgi:hypothetical protein